MQLGRVIGTVVLNISNETLVGVKLLLVQPLSAARQPIGRVVVAADAVGAGAGEEVFFVRGKEASFPFYPTEVPADAGIVGIVDHWDMGQPPHELRLSMSRGRVPDGAPQASGEERGGGPRE